MKNRYKLWIVLSLVIVFVAGVVCGVLIEDLFLENGKREERRERETHRFPTLETMAQKLKLTADQQEQIRQLFSDNEVRFKNLRTEIHERLSVIRHQSINDIKSVLDEEQNIKFDAMIEEYMARREQEHDKREKQKRDSGQKRREDQ
ncbi:MAG: hypothetical protein JXB23_10005 [Candidatus Aminicenantes bacterium]|nr:hypothetical protein [Candidatus Aminicenantes bacterium]